MRVRTCVLVNQSCRAPSEKLNLAQFSRAMSTLQAPNDENKTKADIKTSEIQAEDVEKTPESDESHRFEGKVTPEQELSASVARRRRNMSRKRSESAHRPRDVTPARDLPTEPTNIDETRPKTPERKLRKTGSNNSNKSLKNGNDTNDKQNNDNKNINITQEDNKNNLKEDKKEKETTNEVISDLDSLLNQAKRSASTAPREKPARMKRDKLLKKRSQSTPRPSTEEEEKGTKNDLEEQKTKLKREKQIADQQKENIATIIKNGNNLADENKTKGRENEAAQLQNQNSLSENKNGTRNLVEDFKQAQVLSAKLEVLFKPSSSESSVESTESNQTHNGNSTDEKVKRRKPYAPAAQQYLERRRLEKQLSQTDGQKEKTPKKARMTLKELRGHWRDFKTDQSDECCKIRNLRNRCLNEIGLLMIFCGFGGLMFKFTEGAFENFYKCGVKRVKRDFIDILWKGSHNLREDDWKALARTKLRDFEEQLHNAHEAGVHSYSGQRSWSFMNGIVYALTIITTIGKH